MIFFTQHIDILAFKQQQKKKLTLVKTLNPSMYVLYNYLL